MTQRPKLPPLPDDGLALLDLRQWIEFYGGYEEIPPEAWVRWDELYEKYRQMQKLDARVASSGR